jgi:hypothetical protein
MGKPAFSENIISTLKEESVLTPDFSYTKPVHEGNIDISGNIPRHSMKLYLIDF